MAKSRPIRIIILPTAQEDLQDIVEYISLGSIKYAQIEKTLIIGAIEKLYDFPELGVPFNYKNISARQLVFMNYLIIYRFKAEKIIEILTVHHHSRSIPRNPAFTDED